MDWISVNDRLPEKDGEYLVHDKSDNVRLLHFTTSLENEYGFKEWEQGKDWKDHPGFYIDSCNKWGEYDGIEEEIVKYWQPLPEPVSESNQESKYAKKLDDIFDSVERHIIEKYNIVLDDKDEEFLEKAGMSMMMAFTGLIFEDSLVSDHMSKVVDSELEKYGY